MALTVHGSLLSSNSSPFLSIPKITAISFLPPSNSNRSSRKLVARRNICCPSASMKKECFNEDLEMATRKQSHSSSSREVLLYSIAPLPLLFVATLPGAEVVRSGFGPFVELVKSWNLPNWLVHWGHPGNMAVVLFAMGGYGSYLGFRIRFSDNIEEKAKAKDLHPKLLGGMFFFFALGATGGITALLTSDKPIFESPHALTGFIGLALLTIQTILPSLFEILWIEVLQSLVRNDLTWGAVNSHLKFNDMRLWCKFIML